MTLRALNTHGVANSGLLGIAAGLLVHLGAQLVAGHHWSPPAIVQLALTDVDPLTMPLIAPSALAAYFGRPKTVPATPPPVSADVRPMLPVEHVASSAVSPSSGTAGGSSPHMASILQEVEAGALQLVYSASTTNEATVTSWIAAGEADVKAGFANLVKNIPSVKGAIGLVAAPIEAAVEAAVVAYVDSLFAKYTPAELFTLYIGLLQNLQKDVAAA